MARLHVNIKFYLYGAMLLISIVAFTLPANGQQLNITSPLSGTIVMPGQTLTVTVSVSGNSVIAVALAGEDIGATPLAGAPYSFDILIPQNLTGLKALTALGFTGPDRMISSLPVTIDIEPSTQATQLVSDVPQVKFGFSGDQLPLRFTATLSDGSQMDVTGSTRMVFSTMDASVATIDSMGLVTATGPGTATVSAMYQNKSATVEIVVPAKVRGDLNGDGKVTSDDMKILQAFLDTNSVGSFDARDLNGDGKIDIADAEILATLCPINSCPVPAPVATLSVSTSRLSFADQVFQTSSGAQNITVSNSGTAPVTISGIAATEDFAQSNTCIATLSAGSSCVINVTFTPTVAGIRTGALTITAQGAASIEIALSGNGLSTFALSSSPPMASVVSGKSAIYVISVTPEGGPFNGAVTFSCSGLPPGAVCNFLPASITPSSATSTTLTVNTTAVNSRLVPGLTLSLRQRHITLRFLALLIWGLLLFPISGKYRLKFARGVFAVFILGIFCGCGGLTSPTPPDTAPPPSSSTYNVTVTGTSGSQTSKTSFSLTVNSR